MYTTTKPAKQKKHFFFLSAVLVTCLAIQSLPYTVQANKPMQGSTITSGTLTNSLSGKSDISTPQGSINGTGGSGTKAGTGLGPGTGLGGLRQNTSGEQNIRGGPTTSVASGLNATGPQSNVENGVVMGSIDNSQSSYYNAAGQNNSVDNSTTTINNYYNYSNPGMLNYRSSSPTRGASSPYNWSSYGSPAYSFPSSGFSPSYRSPSPRFSPSYSVPSSGLANYSTPYYYGNAPVKVYYHKRKKRCNRCNQRHRNFFNNWYRMFSNLMNYY